MILITVLKTILLACHVDQHLTYRIQKNKNICLTNDIGNMATGSIRFENYFHTRVDVIFFIYCYHF